MTTTTHNHADDCLMCAVRALTEGAPPIWNPTEDGENISGVVLKIGTVSTDMGLIPFTDIWLGGHERRRIMAYSQSLKHVLTDAAAQIGDTLSVWFDGKHALDRPGHVTHGHTYKVFSANVQRGH